jgi:hypothetical protein
MDYGRDVEDSLLGVSQNFSHIEMSKRQMFLLCSQTSRSVLPCLRLALFEVSSFEPATWEEVEAVLAEVIRSSAGGQMTLSAEVFLAGACAKHLIDKLVLAGFVLMRRPPTP